ncbi:MAG: hypothetical protein Q8R33_22820 [Burkholderiales bacterium]|nr:hypothetical protein [Burkholderiales bacterium]
MTGKKVAVTLVLAFNAMTQVPVPGQPAAALHPVNWKPVAGAAVSVTVVPVSYDSLQSVPQAMPAGAELTVPKPLTTTLRSTDCGVASEPPPPPQLANKTSSNETPHRLARSISMVSLDSLERSKQGRVVSFGTPAHRP